MYTSADGQRVRNLRRLLIVLGLVVVICSLAALVYAFWPIEALQEQAPLVPTLFSPP